MKYPIAHVVWEDHSGGTAGWDSTDSFNDILEFDFIVESVGFILKENKKKIVLVQSLSTNDFANHHISILKKNIRSIKRK